MNPSGPESTSGEAHGRPPRVARAGAPPVAVRARDALRGATDWLRRHPLLGLALLLNVVFLFLPFYDPNNIPLDLSSASHLNSYAPGLSANTWVAGPYTSALLLPGFLSYLATDYSLYAAYLTFKVILFAMTLTLAYALYVAFAPARREVASAVVLFTIGNPAWFLVNYIWVEYDVFPVAFLVLGYVILRYARPNGGGMLRIALAAACITTSIFFYWFAIAAVPALVYYSTGRRERLLLFAWLAGLSAILAAVMVLVLAGGVSPYVGTLLGGSSSINRSGFFGFQYYVKLTEVEYLTVALAIAILLPLWARLARLPEAAALFLTISLVVFTSPVQVPDNYIVVFPFAVLGVLPVGVERVRWSRLWAAIAYPLTGLALIFLVISNAQPDGVGPFFFGYDLFHRDVTLLPASFVNGPYYELFNGATVAALALSFAVVLREGWRHRVAPTPSTAPPSRTATPRSFRPARSTWITWGSVLAAVVVGGFVVNAVLPDAIQFNGSGNPPTYELMPTFLPGNGNVVRPIPGATYTQNGATYTIAAASPPFEFGRWFSGESVELSFSEALTGSLPPVLTLIEGAPISVTLLNLSRPGLPAPGVQGAAPVARNFEVEVMGAASLVEVPLAEPFANISVNSTGGSTAMWIGNESVVAASATTQIWFGKLTAGAYGVSLTVHTLKITQTVPNRYELLPIYATTVAPYLILAASLRFLRRSQRP